MITPEKWMILIAVGLLCGILGGTFGIGGGTILVPALVLLCIPQKDAQGTALAVMIPMAIVGLMRYQANPDITVNYGIAALLAIGSIVGVIIGAKIAHNLDNIVLRRLFAAVMIAIALIMMLTKETPVSPSSEAEISSPES